MSQAMPIPCSPLAAKATTLAIMLYGRDTSLPVDEISNTIYDCVNELGFCEDGAKADLYAQLEERLDAGTKFTDAVAIIHSAMVRTTSRFH